MNFAKLYSKLYQGLNIWAPDWPPSSVLYFNDEFWNSSMAWKRPHLSLNCKVAVLNSNRQWPILVNTLLRLMYSYYYYLYTYHVPYGIMQSVTYKTYIIKFSRPKLHRHTHIRSCKSSCAQNTILNEMRDSWMEIILKEPTKWRQWVICLDRNRVFSLIYSKRYYIVFKFNWKSFKKYDSEWGLVRYSTTEWT